MMPSMDPSDPIAPPAAAPAARSVMTTIPPAGRVVRSLAAPALAYAITLASSLALMVLVVIALAVDSDGGVDEGEVSSDIDIKAIATLIGMPFQLAAMGLGGSLHLGDADFSVSLFAPPLLLTAVFATAVYLLSKASEKAAPSPSTTERVILAASSSLVTAITVVIATRVLAMRDDDVAMHAATVGLFFGTLLIGSVAGFLGRQAAVGPVWPQWLPRDARRATHLVAQHLLVWVAVLIPVAVLWLLVESGVEAALFAVVWGPTAALAAFSLGHFGAWTTFGEQQFAWDLGWFAGVVLPLLAVLLTAAASVAWHLRRRHDTEVLAHPGSWVSLPCAYAVAGLLVCLLSTVGLSGELFGVGGGLTAHGAYWLIPVLAVWGGVIETLSRFVAPAVSGAVPAVVARRLAKGPARLYSPPALASQRIPMSPTDRARAKKALIGVGIVGGLALVGAIVVSILGSTAYTPEKTAEAYLDAIVAEDAEEVLSMAPVDDDEASEALLTSEIYGATEGRITDYEITDVEEDGGRATVTVDLEGPEDGDEVELVLESDGRRALLFDDWKVANGGLAREVTVSVPDSSTSMEVNGVSVPVSAGEEHDYWAWPGSYQFDPYAGSEWLESGQGRTTVPASESFATYAEIDDPKPSAALQELVDSEVEKWITGCMAAKELDPDGCPQEAYGSGDEQRDVSWSLTTMPTVSFDYFTGTFPADLSSDVPGEATVTYEYDASYGFGAPDWTKETEETSFYVSGKVELVDGEPEVTFESY